MFLIRKSRMDKCHSIISENTSAGPLVSVVILGLDRGGDLRRNIESLRKTMKVPYEVIIVDDKSKDNGALEYLEKINGQKTNGTGMITVYHNKTESGCSAGRKFGTDLALKSKSRYILTVDNDVTYTDGWFEKLVSAIEKSDDIGAASPLLLNPENDGRLHVQWNGGLLNMIGSRFIDFVHVDFGKIYGKEKTGGQIRCSWLPGTATLIKADVARKVSYNTAYLSGYEDYDYSFQIAELGYRMLNVPNSVVIHHKINWSDCKKQKRYHDYWSRRWNSKRIFESALAFTERTSYIPSDVKEFFGATYNKKFLRKCGYPNLPGEWESFKDADMEEVRKVVAAIIIQRKKLGISAKGRVDVDKVFANIHAGKLSKLLSNLKNWLYIF